MMDIVTGSFEAHVIVTNVRTCVWGVRRVFLSIDSCCVLAFMNRASAFFLMLETVQREMKTRSLHFWIHGPGRVVLQFESVVLRLI